MYIVIILYINAFAIGYFVSTVVGRSMFDLASTAMSFAWALVLGGTVPYLYNIIDNSGYIYLH